MLSVEKRLASRKCRNPFTTNFSSYKEKKSKDYRCFSRHTIILLFKILLFWFGNFLIYFHLLTFIVTIYLIGVCELYFGLVFHTHVGYEQKTAASVKTLTPASDNILF